MANPEHLEMLMQGVEQWNSWREEKREKQDYLVPDLSGTDLSGMHLVNADLYEATLRDTDLSRARLNGAFLNLANLSRARLNGADLNRASLRGAFLNRADFTDAKLYFADLGKANLGGAELKGATLTGTNLDGAYLAKANLLSVTMLGTMFGAVDLSECENLKSIKHIGPSSIGIDTIYKSRGNIPEKFLRGCGVPEDFIVQIPALVAAIHPIQFYSCFISYSSKDEEFAKRLYNDLQSEGVRCWFAPEDLKIGDRFRVRIDESIRLYDKLVLVLSENSVSSEWVGDEVEAALEKEEGQEGKVILFPLRLDDAVMEIKSGWPAKVRRTRHIGDFSDWKNHDSYKKAFERLMRDLKAGG